MSTTTTTTTEAPSHTLIPSLANDVAVQCLARVPRQYHPVLAAVSKPIRALVSSPEFFAARAALKCTEPLLYLGIRSPEFQPACWFTLYRRPKPNPTTGHIIKAPVPGIPNAQLERYDHATVGPKIYVLGGHAGGLLSTEMWIFDCRFHTWERGPNLPTARKHGLRTVVLDGKIYAFGWAIGANSWADVFDTVAGRWEVLPGPKLRDYNKPVLGCAIRGGKVCVWVGFSNQERHDELRFDPKMKTWEVFSLVSPWCAPSQVNGVLYCSDVRVTTSKGLGERSGFGTLELNLVNGGLPKDLAVFQTLELGGRLVIMGDEFGTAELEGRIRVWCAEIEVKNLESWALKGEVVWSEMVYSGCASIVDRRNLFFNCMKVSL